MIFCGRMHFIIYLQHIALLAGGAGGCCCCAAAAATLRLHRHLLQCSIEWQNQSFVMSTSGCGQPEQLLLNREVACGGFDMA